MSTHSDVIIGPTCSWGCCGPNKQNPKVKRLRKRLSRRDGKALLLSEAAAD